MVDLYGLIDKSLGVSEASIALLGERMHTDRYLMRIAQIVYVLNRGGCI